MSDLTFEIEITLQIIGFCSLVILFYNIWFYDKENGLENLFSTIGVWYLITTFYFGTKTYCNPPPCTSMPLALSILGISSWIFTVFFIGLKFEFSISMDRLFVTIMSALISGFWIAWNFFPPHSNL